MLNTHFCDNGLLPFNFGYVAKNWKSNLKVIFPAIIHVEN